MGPLHCPHIALKPPSPGFPPLTVILTSPPSPPPPPASSARSLSDHIDHRVFQAIYSRSLVYNTCWEDPAVDRQALDLRPSDTMLVITSAGCNVLDYALTGVGRIHAVDANPRQTALLELKLAGIRKLDYRDFFAIFGDGYHSHFRQLYRDCLRTELSDFARAYWDQHSDWFASRHGSFYFHGLSGLVARAFRLYLRIRPNLAGPVDALFSARSLEEQRQIYDEHIRNQLWTRTLNWILGRQITMSLLGVPYPQRREVQAQHAGGVAGFVREAVEYVMRQLPLADNYFWAVYLKGRYGEGCCPEYLKPHHFEALKAGQVDAVEPHTCTVTEFLQITQEPISRFVLLDHMDWMSSYYPQALMEEWDAILARCTPDARIIFRSAHRQPAYLEWLRVGEKQRPLREALHFHDDLADRLSLLDRVHTYAGFHIADVRA